MRPVRYEDFTLGDLTAIRNLLRGGSVIDWHRLYFTDRDEVDRFLRVNEFDPDDDDDMRRLGELREEAVEYLERHLGFQIPDEVATACRRATCCSIASQKGRRRTHACVVLKVMHVMHHLAGRELLTKLPVSDDQIFHLVEEKVLRTVEEIKAVGCPVVEFEWSRKHADSLITKLLAKKESIAADVYDKLRFRMITQHRGAAGVRAARADPAAGPVQLRDPGAVGERHHQDPRDAVPFAGAVVARPGPLRGGDPEIPAGDRRRSDALGGAHRARRASAEDPSRRRSDRRSFVRPLDKNPTYSLARYDLAFALRVRDQPLPPPSTPTSVTSS